MNSPEMIPGEIVRQAAGVLWWLPERAIINESDLCYNNLCYRELMSAARFTYNFSSNLLDDFLDNFSGKDRLPEPAALTFCCNFVAIHCNRALSLEQTPQSFCHWQHRKLWFFCIRAKTQLKAAPVLVDCLTKSLTKEKVASSTMFSI